ncbi:MAG: carbohydrate kinase family protein [Spirochaetes bacterium]|nr:carbohydrate kinase family protein [Spirochaetota bacterium]
MSKIIVAGLINIETTLKVKGFPIEYFPVDYPFFGINTTVSGVGLNITKAMSVLGDDVNLLSLVGDDFEGDKVKSLFQKEGWNSDYIKSGLKNTPQSIILYDPSGRREIYCDLKDIQEKSYDENKFIEAIKGARCAILCNINFSRPLLRMAKEAGLMIATDVHVLDNINDEYNRDYMEAADILFLSDERLPKKPEEFIIDLKNRHICVIIVIGLGSKGALIYDRTTDELSHIEAVRTRNVVNTIGAGDALFSSFVHYYVKGYKPIEAIKRATAFASYKIGETGAANGFLDEAGLEEIYKAVDFKIKKIVRG